MFSKLVAPRRHKAVCHHVGELGVVYQPVLVLVSLVQDILGIKGLLEINIKKKYYIKPI